MTGGVKHQSARKRLVDRVPSHSNRFVSARQLGAELHVTKLAPKAFLETKNSPIRPPNSVWFVPLNGLLKAPIFDNDRSAEAPPIQWTIYTGCEDNLPTDS